ncbi:RAMP superfamily protein [Cyanothece sp. BG0011]|uniref:RAMP superfamily protein n=1 Tax=Cyanothece sp. BG0011 TaxID=2082950 RepID=UPI000D1E332D|nr:RAMP superfamily protein [Cyanothece sp. BG0011]
MKLSQAYQKVPLMYRAQIDERSQLQYINKNQKHDIKRWVSEWTERTYQTSPNFGIDVQTCDISFDWRLVCNGGQDDGIVRPIIGAKGYPFYPGSSMKGAFSRVCTPEKKDYYCGKITPDGEMKPGILRFHGGYPIDENWQEKLIDIIHPQQTFQVKNQQREGGAFSQISLYQPILRFGISSIIELEEKEWQTIWKLWKQAASKGLGSRVSAGYGYPQEYSDKVIYKTSIQGQGIAPTLLDETAEFRPNIFKAGIRGHALRIFGGLTDENTTIQLVEQLFGGTKNKGGTLGLLAMNFQTEQLEIDSFGSGSWKVKTYDVTGHLNWRLTQSLPPEQEEKLQELIRYLTRFAMIFGGFGKSWRRADHRLFYPEYYEGRQQKPLIGCHWQWSGKRSLIFDVQVRKLEKISTFIKQVQTIAKEWMQLQGVNINHQYTDHWREAWHPDKVQVWGRIAINEEESEAIAWLHQPYRKGDPQYNIPEGSIYQSSLTGQIKQIGRLWHRMYPVIRLVKAPNNPKKPLAKQTPKYLELLTLFPDNSPKSQEFIAYLNTSANEFQRLYPQ